MGDIEIFNNNNFNSKSNKYFDNIGASLWLCGGENRQGWKPVQKSYYFDTRRKIGGKLKTNSKSEL